MTAKGSAEPRRRCLGGRERSLCAEAAPGSGRWGAASRPQTPDNSGRGGEAARFRKLFPGVLTAAARPRARSWARPSPAGRRCARAGPLRRNRTEGGARGGSAGAAGSKGGCTRVPGHAKARAPDWAEWSLPWGRLPAAQRRPRSGTGTTWTAASPATVSASPSPCGSAPLPAGSPSTRCNGGRGGRGGDGALALLTRSWAPRRVRAEREDPRGRTIPGSRGAFCCRLKSEPSFRIPRTRRLGWEPTEGWVVWWAGPWTGSRQSWVSCQPFPTDWPCELGEV